MEKSNFRSQRPGEIARTSPNGAASFKEERKETKSGSNHLRVNFENIVKQGMLYQKTLLLKRYKKQYMFYLEKKDDLSGAGPFLKYGRKGKPISAVIDLSIKLADITEGLNGVHVIRD